MANQRGLAEQLFEAALAVRPADRAAFLDWECSGDPDLKQEVEALLAADAEADSFLQHPTSNFLDISEAITIGPYHLLDTRGSRALPGRR